MSHAASDDRTGEVIDGYRLTRLIARGGMGEVYEAEATGRDERIAVKFMHPALRREGELSARFCNEARAASLVRHPGVIRILAIGRLPDDTPYYRMEYLPGESLARRFERLGPAHASYYGLLLQAAEALAAVHACDIVHRDIKPENMMLVADAAVSGGERLKIVDFGIAKLRPEHYEADNTQIQTAAGMVMGTLPFASPEQCAGLLSLGVESDVYSLGIVLYELLSGRLPFQSEDIYELQDLHIRGRVPPLQELAPHLPAECCALVHRMLEKLPARRPTMVEVAAALRRWEAPELTEAATYLKTGSGPLAERPTVLKADLDAATAPPAPPTVRALAPGDGAGPRLRRVATITVAALAAAGAVLYLVIR